VLLVMLPQLLLGAYLSLNNRILYDVYSVCGRLWPISPITDQQIGGLITWIPACMMSVAVTLILWRRWMVNDDRVRLRRTGTQAAMNPIAGTAQ
jgi:putative membrane protein